MSKEVSKDTLETATVGKLINAARRVEASEGTSREALGDLYSAVRILEVLRKLPKTP